MTDTTLENCAHAGGRVDADTPVHFDSHEPDRRADRPASFRAASSCWYRCVLEECELSRRLLRNRVSHGLRLTNDHVSVALTASC